MSDAQPDSPVTPPPSSETEAETASHARRGSWLLWLSGILLWGAGLAAVVTFSGGLSGAASGMAAVVLVSVLVMAFNWIAGAGIALLALYVLIYRPWRWPDRGGMAFWLQVVLVVLALLAFGAQIEGQRSDDAERAQEAANTAKLNAAEHGMIVALRTDDAATFATDYAICQDSCRWDAWVARAVIANAPHSLALLLKGMTPESYAKLADSMLLPGACVNRTYQYSSHSLGRLIGWRNAPAITAQFAPFLRPQDRDYAFRGAVMTGSLDQMNALVKQGVDPLHAKAELGDSDNLIATAASGGAAASIPWLTHAGIVVSTQDDAEAVWRNLADWVADSPPDVATQAIDAWFAASPHIRYAPGAKLDRAAELDVVVSRESPMLIRAMLQHGYRAEDLAPGSRERLNQLLAPISTNLSGQQSQQRWCNGNDWLIDDVGHEE